MSNNYSTQAIITLNNSNNVLSVSVGGTSANDTFRWYRNNTLVATTMGIVLIQLPAMVAIE